MSVPLLVEMLPVTSSVKPKVPVPPTITFFTTIVACLVFVIAQVVVSPWATVMPVAGSPAEVVPSCRRHCHAPAAHPVRAASLRRYVPLSATAVISPAKVVSAVPDTVVSEKALPNPTGVKLKVLSPPTAVFTTRSDPTAVFVNVQTISSLSSTTSVIARVASETVVFVVGSVQASAVSCQPPVGAVSVMICVPSGTNSNTTVSAPLDAEPGVPVFRLKVAGIGLSESPPDRVNPKLPTPPSVRLISTTRPAGSTALACICRSIDPTERLLMDLSPT